MILHKWIRVSRKDVCKICEKPDWCTYAPDFAICCMRVTSQKPCTNGGWLHPIGSAPQVPVPHRPQEPTVDCAPLMARWQRTDRIAPLARLLGVDELPLRLLGVGWSTEHSAWAFPMRDACQRVIGVRFRNERGEKWSVRGGRNGLFVPQVPANKRVFITEGPTDAAALLYIGLFAIGRPSCNGGAAMLCEMLPKLGVRSAVIVADHDSDKIHPDGSQYNPGVDGALRLSEQLPVANCIWLPPTKDAREFVRHGGTAVQIDAMIKNVRWKQPVERN